MTEPPVGGIECLLSLHLNTSKGIGNLVAAYAPTLSASPDTKDKFYSELDELIGLLPETEDLNLEVISMQESALTTIPGPYVLATTE